VKQKEGQGEEQDKARRREEEGEEERSEPFLGGSVHPKRDLGALQKIGPLVAPQFNPRSDSGECGLL
jgi:hypothetical protein